jgi:hypothetical protein
MPGKDEKIYSCRFGGDSFIGYHLLILAINLFWKHRE